MVVVSVATIGATCSGCATVTARRARSRVGTSAGATRESGSHNERRCSTRRPSCCAREPGSASSSRWMIAGSSKQAYSVSCGPKPSSACSACSDGMRSAVVSRSMTATSMGTSVGTYCVSACRSSCVICSSKASTCSSRLECQCIITSFISWGTHGTRCACIADTSVGSCWMRMLKTCAHGGAGVGTDGRRRGHTDGLQAGGCGGGGC